MTQDDLKKYTVVVGEGSGCLFQPMTENFTYIITAKHLFDEDKELESGETIKELKPNGSLIHIARHTHNGDVWDLESIDFVLQLDENYFPHEHADLAILKIPFLNGCNMINIIEEPIFVQGINLCGFPNTANANIAGERYQTKEIQNFGATGNYSISAQLIGNFDQQDIEGMSGGGILSLNGDGITFSGTQSKMASLLYPAGRIGFIQPKYAREIIEYPKYAGRLEKLYPNTLANFSFLRDKAFLLDVDAMDVENADGARVTLLNKAQYIIDSEITPFAIRELFKERLLVNENDKTCLGYNAVWIAWLEFLTIMNIAKYDQIDSTNLSQIFNSYRLMYVHTDDWTAVNISQVYGKSNYFGLKPDSTVIVSSKSPAKTKFKIAKGTLIDIKRPYDKKGFRTDMGIHPFTCFDFVHIDYFKTKCIVQKIEEYQDLSEQDILDKLKQEYNDLFN
ncbi:hypothetical protein QF042_003775 [Pedobacter sp. W3I1]|uniref:ABC-three component system protein n=1 Tax=Pedobacter sp. W3I1 TaxID=3042291 RepID=UPI00277E0AFD|nr:ABC-three component system protein [Pedobacter sp. W3I1]MDQ0640210.1 hypothetical protein [Pedobacter sp. W3I1]